MNLQRTPFYRLAWLTLALLAPVALTAQTTINVNSTVIQPAVKRFGINLGEHDFYDSGQMLKNLVYTNSSFEGEIYQSTIRCKSGTANSCTDENFYSGWPTSFWTNASYQMISGTSVGRSGSICSYVSATYPTSGGIFTFCDSNGTIPANGDYMVVKITMPTNVGWPGGDWQTAVGAGTLTAETYDMPSGTTGKQSALLTAPTASDSIALNMFFDSTKGKTFLQLNGTYQLSFKAKGVAGSKSIAIALNRADAGLTYINQTQPLTSSWAPYTINFNASENGSAIGRVELSFTTSGADTVELDDVSLVKTNTDPTNTTVFRDEVVNTLKALHPGVIRDWQDQLGESLDNMLADPLGRQRTAYTPYNGFDSTDANFQTQSVEYGLTDFLQLCQLVGADPWIVVPSTLSTSEAYNLIDYLAGSSSTIYGGKRAAAGQIQPWTTVFNQIHLEFGNEEWNGGTFKGGSIEYPDAYGQRATAIFAAMLGNASFSASSFDLIVNGQSAAPDRNASIQSFTKNNNSFSIAPYMMYNITQFGTIDQLFGTTFAEAEAFVTPGAFAEGVTAGPYITSEQTLVGKPIVTSEMNLSPSNGAMTQSALNGYASSVGGGIAVLDSMFQQLRAGILTQNLFELPGYSSSTVQSPSNTMYLWGAVLDMGVTNRVRPQYLALQLANSAIGSSTQMLQTVHTGADPTDTQYNYGLNTVSLPIFHYLQSFAFTGNGSNALVVFNVNPDYAEQVNFAGAYAPTGTVVMQRLTSANITDTNELANVVSNTSTTISNFNPSSTITLPPYSMTVFTWGGTVQSAPVISSVTATNITSNSATITWTTDQASSSQVSYGTTTSYGSLTAVNSTLTTTHTVNLTGLTAGTTYDYAAISANSSSASTTSGNFSFTTTSAAPVISAVTATAITSTSATITWTTDQAASSQVAYGTTGGYGSLSPVNAALSTTHSVTLTNLTPGTTYNYAAISVNAASQSTTSGNFTFATTTAAGPVITAVTATGINSTSATITWTTDQAASSQVKYGTTSAYGSLSALNNTLSTTHSVTLTGLTPGTTYNYAAVSANSSSVSSTSGNFTFATTTVAPVITAVTATGINSTSATITWTTDQAASSQVSYGLTSAYGSLSAVNNTLSTSHSVTLTGLTPGATYNYAAISANAASQSTTSGNFTFATTAASAPVISAVTATGITSTSATITWTTDQASSSQVKYGATTAYGSLSSLNGTLSATHSVTLTGLAAGATYNYAVISTNSGNTSSTSGNFTFTTTSATATPPYVGYVVAWGINNSSATVTWSTDVPANTQLAYGTTTALGQLSPLQTALAASHGVVLTGLTSGTTYYYVAQSTAANGATGYSTTYSFTTLGTPPANPAPVISAVTATGITSTSATITWTTDQNSSSQVNYGTTISYGSSSLLNSSLLTTHSVTLTGLAPGTTYNYQAVSTNSSTTTATSSNYTFTTAAAAPAPPVISNIQTTAITSGTVTITWTTDQAANSEVKYGLTTSYGSSTGPDSSYVTSHSVTLTGLAAGTTYNFAVVSANAASLSTTSGNNTFATTAANAKAPYVGYVAFWGVNNSGVTISWSTDVAANTQVAYGTSTALGQTTALQTALVVSHGVVLTGLNSGTTYYFVAQSTGTNGVTGYSTTYSFTTTGTPPATPAPVISAVSVTNITNTSATINWTTDQAASSLVNYGVTTSYSSSSVLNSSLVTAHSVTLSGLTLGTTYNFDVVSANSSSISASSLNATFTTTGSAPAPVISAVSSSNVTSGTATITWTTDQAASSQVNYGLTTTYGSSSALVSTLLTSHSVTLSGLTPNTKYNFDVFSANAANTPVTSGNYTFTTQAATAAPPAVSNVAFWGVTSSGVIISWSTNEVANTAVAYGVTTALGQLTPVQTALTDNHGVTLTGLAASTTYYFVAQSADSGGNTGYSTTYTFTTLAGPPVISSIVATPQAGNVATISWSTSVPTTSYVQYGASSGNYNRYSAQTNLTSTPVCTLSYVPSGKVYYQVVSTNASGAQVVSTEGTFTEP